MQNRQQHRQEVLSFLQKQFSSYHWELVLPKWGSGNETYIAHGNGQVYFIKLGVHLANYRAMASLELTPEVITTGYLEDNTTILVQSYITGRKPSWKDFRLHLEKIATVVNKTHQSLEVKRVLPEVSSDLYSVAGLEALTQIKQRWELYRLQVPTVAEYVEESLAALTHQAQGFFGGGLVASHNDICNANWLVGSNGKIYLIDLESMSQEDPAYDMGALLWWYYPPELRRRFLEIAGYTYDEYFKHRMRVRMAMHCLNIILPRNQSFDKFDPNAFAEWLTDFRAVLAGRENPRGYDD